MLSASTDTAATQLEVTGPLLVVSPHLDDAALSAHALLEREEPVDVLTVFCGRPTPPIVTRWDFAAGFGDSDQAWAGRVRENRAAFADTLHRLHYLGLIDEQYRAAPRPVEDATTLIAWARAWIRTRTSQATIAVPLAGGTTPESDKPASRQIRPHAALRPAASAAHYALTGARASGALFKTTRSSASVYPAVAEPGSWPLSQNRDHAFTRVTMLHALASEDVQVLLYEDFPYGYCGMGADLVARVAADAGFELAGIHRLTVDRSEKTRRLAAYRSQIALLHSPKGRLDRVRGLPPIEWYWSLTQALGTKPRTDTEPTDGEQT